MSRDDEIRMLWEEIRALRQELAGIPLRELAAFSRSDGHIVQGKLDGSLTNGGTATLSVYDTDGTDTEKDVTITADSFIGYVYQATWSYAYFDGKLWRMLSPLGHMGFGQAAGAIAQDATGTVSVRYFNGATWTDTTDNITCRAIGAIASGDRVAWQYDTRGQQFIAGCAG